MLSSVDILITDSINLNNSQPQDILCKPGMLTTVLDSILATKTLGLGECYFKGYFDCYGGLDGLFEMLYRLAKTDEFGNLPVINQIQNSWNLRRKVILNKMLNFSRINPFQVAQEHYDLPVELYKLMLGKTRKYTCGDWSDIPSDLNEVDALDYAQNQSLAYIIQQLNLGDVEKPVILDCGCGWGAIAKYLIDTMGEGNFIYIGVTISREQVNYNKSEFASKSGVHFYNHSFHDPFDFILAEVGVVSVDGVIFLGSLEHAGPTSTMYILEDIWKIVRPNGQIYIQIVGAEHEVALLDPYIDKYIFANTVIMSPAQVGQIIENLRAYRLIRMDNTPQYYYKTLMAWHSNFKANWCHIHPATKASLTKGDSFENILQWKKHWEFYLLECAAFYKANSYPQLYRITLKKNLNPNSQKSILYPVVRHIRRYLNI
jgi:cyclopropane-fatty-acyl-phospholipid synthase